MLAREHLDDPVRREQLEVQYLTLLMKKDAEIWAKRTQFELTLAEKQQDLVNRNGHHATPLDTPTSWSSFGATRGWNS